MNYIPRTIEKILQQAVRQFPAVVVTGPRQSGKTTLLRQLFYDSHRFVTFDDPLTRERAINDPQLFLDTLGAPAILDEIQYVPHLLPYLKMEIDRHRDRNGRFLLSDSQQFHLMKGLTESLAGRVAILNLLPFDEFEKQHIPGAQQNLNTPRSRFTFAALKGAFPEPVLHPEKNTEMWYGSYLQTYLERDVRSLANVGDLLNFQRFIRLLAARCAQILNYSSFASDLGVSVNTVKRWLSILQASQMIYLLEPYYGNPGKRIIKSPKVYFLDVGLVSYLTGIRTEELLFNGPMAGQLFENYVIQEVVKLYSHHGKRPNIYYLRTNNRLEIDLLIEVQINQVIPVEIKLAQTLTTIMARPMERLSRLFSSLHILPGRLISLNPETFPLTRQVTAMPLNEFLKELKTRF